MCIISPDFHPPSNGYSQQQPGTCLTVVPWSKPVNDAAEIVAVCLCPVIVSRGERSLDSIKQLVDGLSMATLLGEISAGPVGQQSEGCAVAAVFGILPGGA